MIHVSAAIIQRGGQVLICRRGGHGESAGLWEFPGGKRETGETDEACLIREIEEELGLGIAITAPYTHITWQGQKGEIRFAFFFAEILHGQAEMREHSDIRWVSKDALPAFAFCPADAAILPLLMDTLP